MLIYRYQKMEVNKMEESKCPIQRVSENKEQIIKKEILEKDLVPAGQKHEFPGEMKESGTMPTTKAYSRKTHIHSPSSRGFQKLKDICIKRKKNQIVSSFSFLKLKTIKNY